MLTEKLFNSAMPPEQSNQNDDTQSVDFKKDDAAWSGQACAKFNTKEHIKSNKVTRHKQIEVDLTSSFDSDVEFADQSQGSQQGYYGEDDYKSCLPINDQSSDNLAELKNQRCFFKYLKLQILVIEPEQVTSVFK